MPVSNERSVYRRFWPLGFALLALSFAISSGCGRSKAEVKGKVTYKGKNLDGGSIQIQTTKGVVAGDIQPDGTYSIKNVPVGLAKVAVAWTDEAAIQYNRDLAKGMREKKAGQPIPQHDKPKDTLKTPAKYADFDKSGLTVEVKGPITPYDIELKD